MRFRIKFLTKWRKLHHSDSIGLEMTNEIRLLPHGENGGKVALWISSFSAMSCHRQTSCTVSRCDAKMAFESWHKTVAWSGNNLVLNEIQLPWSHRKKMLHAVPMSGLKVKQMALKVWENIKPSCLQFRYKSIPKCMKAVVNANRSHTKY